MKNAREKGSREGSEKTLTYERSNVGRKKHFQCESGLFERKNDSKNTCELSNDKKIISDPFIKINFQLGITNAQYGNAIFIRLIYHLCYTHK